MWLTAEDVASRSGVQVQILYAWRAIGIGPHAVKIGKHLRYHADDVAAFDAQLRAEHT